MNTEETQFVFNNDSVDILVEDGVIEHLEGAE